jgi:hypothetical protein
MGFERKCHYLVDVDGVYHFVRASNSYSYQYADGDRLSSYADPYDISLSAMLPDAIAVLVTNRIEGRNQP